MRKQDPKPFPDPENTRAIVSTFGVLPKKSSSNDDWVVLSFDTTTIKDLASSSSKIPNLTAFVNDPRNAKLYPEDVILDMRKIDPSLEGASSFKLAMLKDLLTHHHEAQDSR